MFAARLAGIKIGGYQIVNRVRSVVRLEGSQERCAPDEKEHKQQVDDLRAQMRIPDAPTSKRA
jgi:hypothetical protein